MRFFKIIIQFSSVQFSRSVVSDSLGPHELQHARPPCPSPTPRVHSNSHPWSLGPSNHLILSRPLFLLPPVPPSIRVFSSESTLRMRWPKYWRFSFSIIPSSYYTLFISFGCTRSSLLSVHFLSWQRVEFTYSPCCARASHTKALLTAEHRPLVPRVSSCGAWTQLP